MFILIIMLTIAISRSATSALLLISMMMNADDQIIDATRDDSLGCCISLELMLCRAAAKLLVLLVDYIHVNREQGYLKDSQNHTR